MKSVLNTINNDACLYGCLCFKGQFLKLGGIIKDGQKVSDIKPGALVTVTASGGVYRAKNLVLTAGSWTNGMLSYIGLQLPLKVCWATHIYFYYHHAFYK